MYLFTIMTALGFGIGFLTGRWMGIDHKCQGDLAELGDRFDNLLDDRKQLRGQVDSLRAVNNRAIKVLQEESQ